MHKHQIKACFNKAVDTYDNNCNIQLQAGLNLIHHLTYLNLSPNSLIDLGCGTGIMTKLLADKYKNYQQFHAVDIADKLLKKAQEKLATYQIFFQEKDFEYFFNNQNIVFDLVFSNMALQWSRNISYLLRDIYKNLAVGGVIAFSIPVAGTFKELESTIFFNEFELINTLLIQHNFKIISSNCVALKAEFPSIIAASRSIKAVGANYCNSDKNNFYQLLQSRKSNQPVNLTYNIGYFIAVK